MNSDRVAIISAAFFFFGLAALISVGFFWLGLFVLIALTVLPILWAEEGWRMALWLTAQTVLWLAGIPYLVSINWVWPGVLVLIGASVLLIAVANPDELQARHREDLAARGGDAVRKRKRKRGNVRGIPVPPLDDDDILEIVPFMEDAADAEAHDEFNGRHMLSDRRD